MALPDRYENEPTAELSPDKVKRAQIAKDAVDQWTKELDEARAALEAEIGDAHAGTLNGAKVYTNRPMDKYAVERLRKEHPDLTERYVRPVTVDQFDLPSFLAQHGDVAVQYRVRQFRAVVK